MAYYRDFDFDSSNLSKNLELLDKNVRDFLDQDIDEHTVRGEASMKVNAPWHNRTWQARRGLWADNTKRDDSYTIFMGHTVEYGQYLEASQYEIVAPTLLETGRSFMRSIEDMLGQIQVHKPPTVTIGAGARQGSSRSTSDRAHQAEGYTRPNIGIDKRGRVFAKGAKGRFVSIKKKVSGEITKRTKKTRRG